MREGTQGQVRTYTREKVIGGGGDGGSCGPGQTGGSPTNATRGVEYRGSHPNLEVETDDEEYKCEDDQIETWAWWFGISEKEAGFGEAVELEHSRDDDEAKSACWRAFVDLLQSGGYVHSEIANANGLRDFEDVA